MPEPEFKVRGRPRHVDLVPLGPVDEVAVSVTAAHLETLMGLIPCTVPSWPKPEYAYLPTRYQYDAGAILKALARDVPPHRIRLGLISSDLCLPILTHIYGEAQLGGRAAVVSLKRLGRPFSNGRVSTGKAYERLAKVALHEVAHVIGLRHCREEPWCLMRWSHGLSRIDKLRLDFCPQCTEQMRLTEATGTEFIALGRPDLSEGISSKETLGRSAPRSDPAPARRCR